MAFYPIASNGSGSERVDLGVEYNITNLRMLGLWFQGAVTRDLSFTIKVHYDIGGGPQVETLGPLEAKSTAAGNILNLAALGWDMVETIIEPDPDEIGSPGTPQTIISLPVEVISYSVEWTK